MFSLHALLHDVLDALEGAGVPYALIGGLALAAHGVQRATQDVDALIRVEDRDDAVAALATRGLRVGAETRETVHLVGAGAVDLLLARRPASRAMIDRAQATNRSVKVVAIEDLIGLKIQAYVNDPRRARRDLADIEALLRLPGKRDWETIERYARLFDQWPTMAAMRDDR